MNYFFITSDPEVARAADDAGVDRVFVDLEIVGKKERQGHLSTVISGHTLQDVERVRGALRHAKLLVRTNPLYVGTSAELDGAIAAGADYLMLPMFRGLPEVKRYCAMVAGRAPVIPLVETPQAIRELAEIVRVPGVAEIFIGLNDLHLALDLDFIFEPLTIGLLDPMAKTIQSVGLPFGFGGIARVGEGLLPGELVLAEHLRLGSTRVILSRTFRRDNDMDIAVELGRLRDTEASLALRTPDEIERDRLKVVEIVKNIVRMKT